MGAKHQEEITIVNEHALNISAPNFMKQALLHINEKIFPNTIIVHDVSTPHSSYIDQPYKKLIELQC
jgi:hypothetical protein